MKRSILYICFATVALFSCKNELDVLAPGEETISVYGILNPNQAVQNIRINKVFITEGDAVIAAQDQNTINYGPGELKVTLQRFMNGSTTPTLTTVGNATKKEIVLTETVVTTANGTFNVGQRLWQTTDKLYNSGEYKLTITNLSSGKEYTSQTTMVDSVKSYPAMPFIYVSAPAPNHYPVHCGTGNGAYTPPTASIQTFSVAYVNYSTVNSNQSIRFRSVANAKLYKVVMRFHYIDTLADGSYGGRKYVDMNFSDQISNTLTGGEEMMVKFNASEFYANIASEIPKQATGAVKNRTAHYMEYIISACGESLQTFLQVNQPSNTIAQDKPNYSNIKGGVGVFGSISSTSISKELWYDFIDRISDDPSTSSLQFNKNRAFICP